MFAGSAFGGRRLTVVAHLALVRSHRFASRIRVTPLHGFKNTFVMNLAALRPARNPEDAQSLLPQKSHDGIEQRQDKRVGGTLGQGQMKIEIRLDVGFRISPGSIHGGHGFTCDTGVTSDVAS